MLGSQNLCKQRAMVSAASRDTISLVLSNFQIRAQPVAGPSLSGSAQSVVLGNEARWVFAVVVGAVVVDCW